MGSTDVLISIIVSFQKYWTNGKSEGSLIENDKDYPVFADGKKEEI
ncbi:MAG: hypothetical protein ACI94Y_001314 [Maribacter sp.]|jgi:hypothetical protein